MLKTAQSPNLGAKFEAFTFQKAAVRALRDKPYAAVFHEQGLGKTKIGIDLGLNWLQEDVVDSVVIVTKRSLVPNWQDEIRQHSFLTPRVLTQDRTANFYAFNSPARLYLTHYEVLESERSRLALFLRTRRVGVILDEAQKVKNPDTGVARAALSLAPGFARRVIMTGTPVANRPYDLWAQVYFLDQGKALGDNYRSFKATLDLSNDMASNRGKRTAFEAALAGVFGRISEFTVRETKKTAGIELPGKTIENVSCELEHRQREIYQKYRADLSAIVVRQGLPVLDDADDILKRLLRLVQVASNPAMLDQSYRREPGKFLILQNLLHKIRDDGEKVIVWTSFIENSTWLSRELADFGTVVINGTVSIDTRTARLRKFKADSETRVLVATPGAAKEGLTLTAANHAVFFDRSFSLDDYLQAQDRIHRISQTKECRVYNLVAMDTIDEWVDELIEAKSTAAQVAQGDIGIDDFRLKMNYSFGDAVRRVLNAA